MKELTVGQAIRQLEKIAASSENGNNTVLCVCIPGIEYQTVSEIKLDCGIAVVMQPFDLEKYEDQIVELGEMRKSYG